MMISSEIGSGYGNLGIFVQKQQEHVFFYKKFKSGAGRLFLKFSGHFVIKSFLHVS